MAISERFGFYRSKQPGKVVWIHAVSAGETIAAVPLVRNLLGRGYVCLVTNMTPTGRERVQALLADEVENCLKRAYVCHRVLLYLNQIKIELLI